MPLPRSLRLCTGFHLSGSIIPRLTPCGALWGFLLCSARCLRANEKAPRLRDFLTENFMSYAKVKTDLCTFAD